MMANNDLAVKLLCGDKSAQSNGNMYEKLKNQFISPDYYLINELSKAIDKAIEELPDLYRKAFKMSRFGTETNSQIAEQLEISIKSVEYRITNSLKILHTKLKDYLISIIFI